MRAALLVLLLVIVSGAVTSLAVADRQVDDRLAPGMTVAGIDVGGLTRDAALARVWQGLRRKALRDVRVRVADRTHTLTARDARVRLRLPAAIARAQAASREGSFLQRGWRALVGGEVARDIPVRPTASRRAVGAFVAKIERGVAREPVDARVSLSVDRLAVTRERPGRRLMGGERLAERITAAMGGLSGQRRFSADVGTIAPKVTRDDLWRESPSVVTVSRSARQVRLFERGRLVTSYRVAVGQPGYATPLGRFAVQAMQKNPVWNVPDSEWAGKLAGRTIPAGDPRNPIIARWIGFNGAVGFHGTKSLESLGRAASRGCIRMRPADIIALFSRVRVGTPVLVAR